MNLAVPHVVRHHNMQLAIERGFPVLTMQPRREETLSIVGYGPSLLTTWRQVTAPLLTLSGAHDFMLRNRVEPTYHADCDPRIHKSEFVRHPCERTTYLMASCCHPQTWDYLCGQAVLLWHKDNGPETRAWLNENEPYSRWCLTGGSSIGIASLALAKVLGFRRVRLFGFDSCYADDGRLHADAGEPGELRDAQVVEAGGLTYVTTENMKRQAEEFEAAAAGLEYEIVGEGLLKAMLNAKKVKEMA